MLPTAEAHSAPVRGMTLVELIVAMAIFTTIMSGVVLMFNSVTSTVQRSYRTMDMMEKSRAALVAIEQDVKTTFSAPAIGADFHFYGEPNGFIMVGIAPNGRLGRLSYAVHRDTSRTDFPHNPQTVAVDPREQEVAETKRGERLTLMRQWADMENRFTGLADFYPEPALDTMFVDFEVEVVYGVLLRRYEEGITSVEHFPLERYAPAIFNAIGRPGSLEDISYEQDFPWFTKIMVWPNLGDAAVPWYVREKLETVEKCHYWLQLLQGPRPSGMPSVVPWNPVNIWDDWAFADVFWDDPNVLWPDGNPEDWHLLWDYVMAEDFVIATYLLNPAIGERIVAPNIDTGEDAFIPVLDNLALFDYRVESGATSNTFNTLFDLDHGGAFQALAQAISANPPNTTNIPGPIAAMTETRQFYDMGSPLQSRLPSAFTVNLTVLNPPVVAGAPPDHYNFSQTIHLPAGFLRRSRAIQ